MYYENLICTNGVIYLIWKVIDEGSLFLLHTSWATTLYWPDWNIISLKKCSATITMSHLRINESMSQLSDGLRSGSSNPCPAFQTEIKFLTSKECLLWFSLLWNEYFYFSRLISKLFAPTVNEWSLLTDENISAGWKFWDRRYQNSISRLPLLMKHLPEFPRSYLRNIFSSKHKNSLRSDQKDHLTLMLLGCGGNTSSLREHSWTRTMLGDDISNFSVFWGFFTSFIWDCSMLEAFRRICS